MLNKGFFITFEGAEGAGKSTQCQLLADKLQEAGFEVVLTKEPGAGDIGAKIRELILNPENTSLQPKAEAFLYAADRAQHVAELILPALDEGKIVICDRYVDSNIAYQAYGRGEDINLIRDINKYATAGIEPNLTILITIDPSEGLKRAAHRGAMDRMEKENIDFHNRVTAGFLQIAADEPGRVKTVLGNDSIDDIAARIWDIVEMELAKKDDVR